MIRELGHAAASAAPRRKRASHRIAQRSVSWKPRSGLLRHRFDDATWNTPWRSQRPPPASISVCRPQLHALRRRKPASSCGALRLRSRRPKRNEAGGLDAVIAQGFEAGGHRGTLNEPFELGEIGLFSLLPQVVDALRIPVVPREVSRSGEVSQPHSRSAPKASSSSRRFSALRKPSSIRCFGARCTNLALRTRSSRAASASSSFRVKVTSRTCGHMT